MAEFYPEGYRDMERVYTQNTLMDAYYEQRILEARAIICDSEHNLIVDLGCMEGIIHRDEGALGIREGTVRDIAVISRVNRSVSFVVTDFQKDDRTGQSIAVLSRRKAQEICMENYIKTLVPGDVINAKVTHLEPFGAFCDIGCGIVSLLPIDMISVSRLDHPRERFSVGMNIRSVVKSIENNRISLTHKELLGTWEENAKLFEIGETVTGIIRSVEDYGAFIELAPNLAGLAEPKDDLIPGQKASVYIKNIIPSRMKLKLIVIDTFKYDYMASLPKYFFNGDHMDRFLYSPAESDKIMETIF